MVAQCHMELLAVTLSHPDSHHRRENPSGLAVRRLLSECSNGCPYPNPNPIGTRHILWAAVMRLIGLVRHSGYSKEVHGIGCVFQSVRWIWSLFASISVRIQKHDESQGYHLQTILSMKSVQPSTRPIHCSASPTVLSDSLKLGSGGKRAANTASSLYLYRSQDYVMFILSARKAKHGRHSISVRSPTSEAYRHPDPARSKPHPRRTRRSGR